ncbi:MAG: PAS domain-containing protein [Anaerolineales bacterium]|nr:PAS domain-containing protein [Chloroflexota bacterium]MBL6979971.1 PAS domain-containing protein [Anaerolineales bacterium]
MLAEKNANWYFRRIQQVWTDTGLTIKLAIMVIGGLVVIVGVFGYLGVNATETSTQRTLQERVLLAQVASNHLDYLIARVERMMLGAVDQLEIVPSPPDQFAIELTSIEEAFHQIQTVSQQVYLLNNEGEIISIEPKSSSPESQSLISISSIKNTLQKGSFELSGLVHLTADDKPSVLASVSVRDSQDNIKGALVAKLTLDSPEFSFFLRQINLGKTGNLEVADSNGMILISSHADRLFHQSDHKGNIAAMIYQGEAQAGTCHDCHADSQDAPLELEVIAFSPLTKADWGVVIRQEQGEAFAETRQLQFRIVFFGIVALGFALIFALLFMHSVTKPLHFLNAAAQRIANGDFITPISLDRGDEIGVLAKSFDNMRTKVQNAMDEINEWNMELDQRVHQRTMEVEAAQEEARLARDYLQAIIDGLSDDLIVIDSDFKVCLANAVVRERWGPEKNMLGLPCWVVNHDGRACKSPHCECPVEKVLKTGKTAKTTHYHPHRQHEGRFVDIVATPLLDDSGSIIGVIELIRDVTQEKKREQVRRKLLEKVITAQEEERKRIARELHDEVAQELTGLIMNCAVLEQTITHSDKLEKSKSKLITLRSLSARALQNLRALIYDLRPDALDDLGLELAIRGHIKERLRNSDINTQVKISGFDKRPSSETEITLFRLVQEGVTNILRHSEATEAKIHLELIRQHIRLIIEDNGKGFDPEKGMAIDRQNGWGLNGMNERAELLGGTMLVESKLGDGTRLTAEIPLEG